MRAIVRCHELAISVQDEQIARPIEDDAPARPVFVFVRPHQGAQGGIIPVPRAPGRERERVARRCGAGPAELAIANMQGTK